MAWTREGNSIGFLFGMAGATAASYGALAAFGPPHRPVAALGALLLAAACALPPPRDGPAGGLLLGGAVPCLMFAREHGGWIPLLVAFAVGAFLGNLFRAAEREGREDVSEVFE